MEGKASTFEKVLADFESRLPTAEFVAIDTELTGVDIEGEPDTFEESATVRLEKICRIAERYTLIQLGLTLVGRQPQGLNGNHEGKLWCASYNLFAFPYVGQGELAGREPGFMCQASALQFNAHHRVDFNTWIGQGIPYMSREDERRYFGNPQDTSSNNDQKIGLLRLWKALCQRKLPFVVHSPLDLFFLLVAFERCPLPRGDPRALAVLIRQCTPKVYDTAHLHGAVGRFRRLGLAKFFEDAKSRHDELLKTNGSSGVHPLDFDLVGETGVRYSKPHEQLAHEAGFDSLLTAQLFAYLRAIAPARVREGANRLFLYRSVEYVDIDRAALEGSVGCSMFDLSRVTLLVARLQSPDNPDAPRLIAQAGSEYKWMDSMHILVVLRASGGAAVRKAADLAAKVRGVESWMPFDEWRVRRVEAQPPARAASTSRAAATSTTTPHSHGQTRTHNGVDVCSRDATAETAHSREVGGKGESVIPSGTSNKNSGRPTSTSREVGIRRRWGFILQAIGVSGLLMLLALIRARRRLRQR